MNKILAALVASTAISMVGAAYAAKSTAQAESNVKYKDDGGYEANRTSESTTTTGTTHKSESTVDVDVDSKGRIEKSVESKATTDPKGLMNKINETSETSIEEKDHGGYKQTTLRKHTNADGTNITFRTVTDVNVDNNGNVTTTATTEKTVDPEGLMNKTTTKSKTKTINGRVVEKTGSN